MLKNNPKKGKKLLVVGGCGGIGKAVVNGAIELGLEVAVFDLPSSLKTNPPPLEVLSFQVNATIQNDLVKAFQLLQKQWPTFDYLVNLVGFVGEFQSIEQFSEKGWNETLQGNLDSTFLTCQQAIPFLEKGGAIVNMSSGLAAVGRPGYAAYAASKAAIISITKTLAAELAPNIRVNAVAPGAVQTAFLSGGLSRGGSMSSEPTRLDLESYKKMVPLQEIAQADDIAAPMLFLLSEGARHITGQTLHINGGALMNH